MTAKMRILELTRIVLSSAPVARSFPSGLKHTLLMYRSFVLSAVSSTKTLYNGNNQRQEIRRPTCIKKSEPSFSASFRIIDLGRLIAARCQILAVRRKTYTTNDTKDGKRIVNPGIPVIEVADGATPPTFRGLGCGPS